MAWNVLIDFAKHQQAIIDSSYILSYGHKLVSSLLEQLKIQPQISIAQHVQLSLVKVLKRNPNQHRLLQTSRNLDAPNQQMLKISIRPIHRYFSCSKDPSYQSCFFNNACSTLQQHGGSIPQPIHQQGFESFGDEGQYLFLRNRSQQNHFPFEAYQNLVEAIRKQGFSQNCSVKVYIQRTRTGKTKQFLWFETETIAQFSFQYLSSSLGQIVEYMTTKPKGELLQLSCSRRRAQK